MRFNQLVTLALVCCALQPASADDAISADKNVVQAAFLYNFAVFTEWPDRSGEALNLCILGKDPFENALSRIEGKMVGNARLVIKHLAVLDDVLRGCQMVFISASEKQNLPAVLNISQETGILTIADLQGAAQQGVMIGLGMEQNRITFEVNLDAARHAKLNISSKLLRLAKTVY